jgi:isopenicillin-N epimerase
MNAWRFMQQRASPRQSPSSAETESTFSIVSQEVQLPVTSNDEIVEQLWAGVTPNTKVIFLSHITSPTALTIPVAEICRRSREKGIITIIDGAHVPGQLPVDVRQIGADFYVATCHKWMCAPKGSAFMYARREMQHLVEPLVVGWGWGDEARNFDSGNDFLDSHEWLGTHDPSAYLTVPKAIAFQEKHDWPSVRQKCHALAIEAIERAVELPNVQRVHGNDFFQQMALLELAGPDHAALNPVALKKTLYDRHRIEIPVIPWRDRVFLRVSVQAYNTEADIDQLIDALRQI